MYRQGPLALLIVFLHSALCISYSFAQISQETPAAEPTLDSEDCATPALIVTKSNPDWTAFRNNLRRRIFRNWFPPKHGGACKASFILSADGSFREVYISSSSGQSITDLAALEAIRNSQPMPGLPQKIDSAQTTICFDYDSIVNKEACIIITKESQDLREKAELAISDSNYPLAIRLLNQALNIEGPRSEYLKKKLSEAKQASADSLKSKLPPNP